MIVGIKLYYGKSKCIVSSNHQLFPRPIGFFKIGRPKCRNSNSYIYIYIQSILLNLYSFGMASFNGLIWHETELQGDQLAEPNEVLFPYSCSRPQLLDQG
jgi:hypothetical protein